MSAAPSSSGTSSTGPRPGSASATAPTGSSPAAAPSPTSRACTSPATAPWPAGPHSSASLRIFASEDGHFSVQKSARLLGLGDAAVVTVPTDSDRRMDVGALSKALSDCVADGLVPMAVVATAGTTDFGAIDPLRTIAELCQLHDTWLHVDAAYGGGLLASQKLRHRLAGIERADSVTVDYHKTWFQPVSSSALIVRDGRHLGHVTWHADYLNPKDAAHPNQVDKSLQTTRRFDALKLWLTLRIMGPDQIGEYVEQAGRPRRRRCMRTSTSTPTSRSRRRRPEHARLPLPARRHVRGRRRRADHADPVDALRARRRDGRRHQGRRPLLAQAHPAQPAGHLRRHPRDHRRGGRASGASCWSRRWPDDDRVRLRRDRRSARSTSAWPASPTRSTSSTGSSSRPATSSPGTPA